ncbi:hypothetical protein ACFL6C_00560 [Myxococcota bacterium]
MLRLGHIWAIWTIVAVVVVVPRLCHSRESPRLFGLAIGYNGTDEPDQIPLKYADDDAIKNAQLLADLGAEHVVLTEPDPESRAMFPEVESTAPTHAAVKAALAQLDARILEEKSKGHVTHLFVFYAGHGDVEHNEGFVHLADGRLSRTDLREIATSTGADEIHVVVDACKSYFLVFDRGAGGRRRPALGEFPEDLKSFPANVGFLLSASSAQDSHEWEAFQSGVFSHEVRSALRGAADLNSDGEISYEEAVGFIFAANRSIPNPKYRPRFFARAPNGRPLAQTALVVLPPDSPSRLRVGPGVDSHMYVENSWGSRIADFHPSESQSFGLLLPYERPLFVRDATEPREYEIAGAGPIALAALSVREPTARSRGAEHIAFSALFSTPFEELSVSAYYLAEVEAASVATFEPTGPPGWLQPALLIGTVTFAAGGGTLTGLGFAERGRIHEDSSNRRRLNANARIDRYNTGAVVLYSLAATSLVTYLVWRLWPEDETEVRVVGPSSPPDDQVAPTDAGPP